MCRLLGFKCSVKSDLTYSLKDAENALQVQSLNHKDGWGIGYYIKPGVPHLEKHTEAAHKCFYFSEIAGKLLSDAVIAHVRKAHIGPIGKENCQPFVYGEWLFAHNGDILGFAGLKQKFLQNIHKDFHKHILGETDSEHIFYLFLANLKKIAPLVGLSDPLPVKEALHGTLHQIEMWCKEQHPEEEPPTLNLMISNYKLLIGVSRGEPLYYHQHAKILEKIGGPDTAPERAPLKRYVLIASEKTSPKEHWEQLPPNSIIAVNGDFHCEITTIP
ncbi:MAG TPA: class II glutamine amidotransferase [Bdellovibrionota bacterium]|nr:class II glutamine amidotransferase [Bdellovibrionota bacterium]